ncbi:15-hydroxyprostaglandin dehydrogenase [NAD(+)]-like [Zerene cesonia]|uniref:15-hydroxyprostaglandin dehydrogenase [NAD(+)]-like n=1 Tax=Zerene cesonia TaxID=33412 RepID=UPI0018E59001|nr:15-hydroxyprostaglandin dehydrogenase [NAD(+)]-like [Zerene cesonia]
MSYEIKNKIVAITGAASGIGYETAIKFAQKGAKLVLLLDLNEKLGNEAVNTINSKFGSKRAVFYKCDVRTDVETVWKKIIDEYGNVDVLVNSAGVFCEKNTKKTIDINVTALIDWSLKFWECNRKDKSGNGGTIINLASIYGYRVDQYIPIYQASKFAVMGFTRSLGHEYNFNRSGVRVVVVCPGFTETPIVHNIQVWDDVIREEFVGFTETQAWQKPDDVANAIVEVFENAKSGTAWNIEGGNPVKQV